MQRQQRFKNSRNRQQGMSLVELMIALAIGAALIGGIIQIFTSNNAAFRSQQATSRMQENARFAFHFLASELRQAGYSGCAGQAQNKNILNKGDETYDYLFNFNKSVEGYEYDGDAGMPQVIQDLTDAPKVGTDIVVTRRAGETEVSAAEDQPDSNAANLKAEKETPFKQGDILTISDCQSSWTFQVTQVKDSNTTVVINKGSTTDPGNDQKVLQDDLGPDFSISKAVSTIYYISDAGDEPALYRKKNNQPAEELVTGVEDMQIEYGLDNDIEFSDDSDPACPIEKPGGTGDGQVDEFKKATKITDNCEWARVIGVRVSLLIRSQSDRLAPDGQPYHFAGANTSSDDGRLRHVVNSTITLRNKTR